MKTTVLKLVLIIFLINIPNIESYAQKISLKKEVKNNDKDKGRDNDKDKKDKDKGKKSIPIDGGIGLLLAAGVGFGARKFIKSKSNTHP